MARFKVAVFRHWLSRRRWRKRHQADIRAFMRFQAERVARRQAAGAGFR